MTARQPRPAGDARGAGAKATGTRLLLFARYPAPGQAKTRLIPELGEERAALLHRRMTEHAAALVRGVCLPGDTGATVCFTGARRGAFRAWLGPSFQYSRQSSGGLGERLGRAFEDAFRQGAKRVIALGSDSPDLTRDILSEAIDALRCREAVIGPAADGGYYLIGTTRFIPGLFSSIDWGTERVYEQTASAFKRQGISFARLPVLSDVDRSSDLPVIRAHQAFKDVFAPPPIISVIIPALNEGASIGKTLERAFRAEGVEVIVADGASTDDTRRVASASGAAVIVVPGGRAAQMNTGAAAASGRILLFLHADTLLPERYDQLVRRTLDDPSTVAGAFSFKTDGEGLAMRFVEWAANLRSSFLGFPYGDQALFMEKRVFDEAGGFASLPVMEDFDLVRRLRSRGPVVTVGEPVVTSARRWQRLGALRASLRNQRMIAGFLAGEAPEDLSRLYRR